MENNGECGSHSYMAQTNVSDPSSIGCVCDDGFVKDPSQSSNVTAACIAVDACTSGKAKNERFVVSS